MVLSFLFHVCTLGILPGWLLLAVLPRWRWTQRITTFILLLPLAALYIGLFAANWNSQLSFGSLDQVYAILQSPEFVLAGWIHFLALDLFAGSWEVRDAQRIGIPHVVVLPCLAATLLAGPVGVLLYLLFRLGLKKKIGAED